MKRPWVIGCLAVVVLVVGVGGALAYNYFVRPAMATVNAARQVARIPEIERRVVDRSSYVPPADGVLTDDQVQRYLRAAGRVRTELQDMGAELEARFDELEERRGAAGVREVARAYSDLLGLIVRAKEVQVEALNAERFSLGEYGWVRTQTLAAAGLTAYNVDLQSLAEASGREVITEVRATVPPENVALVDALEVDLEEYLPLAMFGL